MKFLQKIFKKIPIVFLTVLVSAAVVWAVDEGGDSVPKPNRLWKIDSGKLWPTTTSGDVYVSGNLEIEGTCTGCTTGLGDVTGPTGASDNALARYDGTTGKLLKDSSVFQDVTGQVGIGTSSPNETLDVRGSMSVGNASTLFVDDGAGAVGIGIGRTTPRSLLQAGLISEANNIVTIGDGNGYASGIEGYSAELADVTFSLKSDILGNFNIKNNFPNADILLATNSGSIGIENANPSTNYLLHLGDETLTNNFLGLGLNPLGNAGFAWNNGVAETATIEQYGGGLFTIQNLITDEDIFISTVGAGNVGIGTNTPDEKLDVAGTGKFSTGLISPKIYPLVDAVAGFQINKADGTSNIITVDTVNSRVGIGTNAPERKLDLRGNQKIIAHSTIRDAWETGQIVIENPSNSDEQFSIGYDTGDKYGIMQVGDIGTGWLPLSLNPRGGNVGIGLQKTEVPFAALDLPASDATRASLRLRNGVEPTSLYVGSLWSEATDGGKLLYRKNATQTVDLINPLPNTVLVYSEDDFPAAVAGKRQLEAKTYKIIGTVITADTLVPPATGTTTIQGENFSGSALYYSGTGTLFENLTFGGGQLITFTTTILAPAGQVFDLVGDASGFVLADTTLFYDVDRMGTVQGSGFTMFFNNILNTGQGIVADSTGGFTFSRNFVAYGKNQADTKLVTVRGANGASQITSNFFITAGANESILNIEDDSTVVSAVALGNTANIVAGGAKFATGSKDQTDPSWKFDGNSGIPDSTVTAEANLVGNTLTTDIPTNGQDAWVIVNATTWTEAKLERSEVASDGTYKYTGKEGVALNLAGTVTLEPDNSTFLLSTRFFCILVPDFTVTFTNATNTINEVGTALQNGDIISFKNSPGTLPAELRKDVMYYVINKATDSFQVSYTEGGTAVAFTDDGTPVNSYSIAIAHGGVPVNSIAANNPRSITPIGLTAGTQENGEIVLSVSNRSGDTDIEVLDAYYKIKK